MNKNYEISASENSEKFLEEIRDRLLERNQQLARANQKLEKQIAERKAIEKALEQTEEKYRSIFENAPHGIFQTTAAGRYISANPTLAAIYGYSSAQELIAEMKDISKLYVDANRRAEFIEILEKKDVISNFESPVYRQDGKIIWISENARIVKDKNGNFLYYEGTVEDISDRKYAENKLIQLSSAMEQIADSVMIANTQGIIEYVNPAFEKLTGYKKVEVIGQKPSILKSGKHSQKYYHKLWQTILSGKTFRTVMVNCRKDKQLFYEEKIIAPIRDNQGNITHFVSTGRDITESKKAVENLRRSEKELREKTNHLETTLEELKYTQYQLIQTEKMSSLGHLVAGVAHEINNPVNCVYGNLIHATEYIQDLLYLLDLYGEHYPEPVAEIIDTAETIEIEFLKEDLPKLLDSMKIGADRIRQIVLSLRSFSRIDDTEKKTVDIREGIDNTLLILQNRLKGKSGRKEIKVIKEYADVINVDCFPGQLNQVFMNLLTNAIDALEEYEHQHISLHPALEIRIRTEVLDNGYIAIHIADNGPGMTTEVKQKLFQPFFTTKPVGKGTGLGLSISYQIVVEKHGGFFHCNSSIGQGTEFIIEIPIKSNITS